VRLLNGIVQAALQIGKLTENCKKMATAIVTAKTTLTCIETHEAGEGSLRNYDIYTFDLLSNINFPRIVQ